MHQRIKVKVQIKLPKAQISEFCQRWEISELAIFGSALREDFRSNSDLDLLVRFLPNSRHTLSEMVRMQGELELIFGRKVDLVSRRGVEMSRNPIRKKAILDSAVVIYGS